MSWEDGLIEAEGLLFDPAERSPDLLNRIEALLDRIATDPEAPSGPVAWTRARAIISLQLEVPVPPLRGLNIVLEALDHAQVSRLDYQLTILGLAAANFFILLKDPALEIRFLDPIEKALRWSRHTSREAPQLPLANRLLALVHQRALALGIGDPAERMSRYVEGRDLAGWSIEHATHQDALMDLAGNFEIAGMIETLHPMRPLDALGRAISLLIEARDRYRALGGAEDARRCAFELVSLWRAQPGPPTVDTAEEVERNMLAVEWSYTLEDASELRFPPGRLEAAQTWLAAAQAAQGKRAEAALRRAEDIARLLVNAPPENADAEIRARGCFILGNAVGAPWLAATNYSRLDGDGAAIAVERLAVAREAFEQCLAAAPASDEVLIQRTWAQLAKVYTAAFSVCGDHNYVAPALAAWREALARASGHDRVAYSLNLVSLLLGIAPEGDGRELDEAEQRLGVLDEALLRSHGLLETRRDYGQRLEALRETLGFGEAEKEYRRAIDVAGDPIKRRRYLLDRIPTLPDYLARRALFLSAGQHQLQAELAALRRSDYPTREPEAMRRLEAEAELQRKLLGELLAKDQETRSAAAGKAFVLEHLGAEQAAPFVLVLRSFDLERRFIKMKPPSRGDLAEILASTDAIGGAVVAAVHRVLSDIVEALATECAVLLVVNTEEMAPSKGAKRLFADPRDWRTLLFSLAAQAAVVLVAIADGEDLTAGVSDELRAVAELRAADRTVVLLESPLRSIHEAPVHRSQARSDGLREDLTAQGFELFFFEGEVEEDAEPFLEAARTIGRRRAPGSFR